MMSSEKDKPLNIEESLYALADDMNSVVMREHRILQEELGQMCELVSDAAKTLADNFDTINKLAAEQAALFQTVKSSSLNDDQGRHGKITEISRKINSSNAAVMRALQFDDIVQQLAAHSRNRAVQMEQLFAALTSMLNEQKKVESQQHNHVMQSIKAMQQEVEKYRAALEKSNPVKQASISEGKIELF